MALDNDADMSAAEFLRTFMREIVHNPLERPGILQRWTDRLDARDAANRAAEPQVEPEEEQ